MTSIQQVPCDAVRRAEEHIHQIDTVRAERYAKYWRTIQPKSHKDYYDIGLFAFMSIHTGWEANVRGFLAVRDLPLNCSVDRLRTAIIQSKVGLHQNRTRGIFEFRQKFWKNPEAWYPVSHESMQDFRDRMAKELYGIGLAKTSFILEMAYPETCGVVCLDTHILQLYGLGVGNTPTTSTYRIIEDHWLNTCKMRNVPSPIARHIYWDNKQGQQDTRYWSYVLEKNHKKCSKQKKRSSNDV